MAQLCDHIPDEGVEVEVAVGTGAVGKEGGREGGEEGGREGGREREREREMIIMYVRIIIIESLYYSGRCGV